MTDNQLENDLVNTLKGLPRLTQLQIVPRIPVAY